MRGCGGTVTALGWGLRPGTVPEFTRGALPTLFCLKLSIAVVVLSPFYRRGGGHKASWSAAVLGQVARLLAQAHSPQRVAV